MYLALVLCAVLGAQPDAPTPVNECYTALALADLDEKDVFYDLGCGDGRLCVFAAKRYGCKAVGIDYDVDKVRHAQENVRFNKLGSLVAVYRKDLREVDFEKLPATVYYMYLPMPLVRELTPKLQRCRGVKVISYMHRLPIPHQAKKGNFFIYQF